MSASTRSSASKLAPPAPASSTLLFLALTFAVAWACFVPLATGVRPRSPLAFLLEYLGTFSPALVALALAYRAAGGAGVRALAGRILRGPVAARWYVFAVVYMAAIKLVVAVLHRVTTGAWPPFGTEPWYVIPVAIAISTPFQAGEEIGWRGYALPRLAARMGLGRASLLLGVVWAVWHLPLFYVPGADKQGQSFLVYTMQVTALSVAVAWLYAHVNGSLLPVMVLHAAVNNSLNIVPSAMPGATRVFGLDASRVAWLTLALLWACAAFFLARMPRDVPAAKDDEPDPP